MKRAEVTALAVERLSVDSEARRRGAESISDATVGRKIADKDEVVDARAVRTIVVVCGLALERRGRTPADVEVWLRARTRLVEQPVEVVPAVAEVVPAVTEPPQRKMRTGWLAAALVITVAGVAAASADRPPHKQSCARPDQAAGPGLSMGAPAAGTIVRGDSVEASGTVELKPGERPPWLLLHAIGACRFYLVQPVVVDGTSWKSTLYVNPDERGMYGAYVVVVGAADDERFHELAAAGGSPSIERLPEGARSVHVTVRCCS
ncbi:hypothetical protein [Lentzea nigeriaca]|uniref:hypothetical protein n=1 Tax=Lentzea nigeriaca TaxID=1128665 RepID=UPI00195E6759|nr:hypothetical protein [Lentzea nigeriaca]MBM7857185.1 hypothetical protein [Lentzea nigeriaca]